MQLRVWRGIFLVLVALQGATAWRATTYDLNFRQGVRAYRQGAFARAREAFARARAIDDADTTLWEWQGDAASAIYSVPPSGGWPPARANELLDAAWAGYTGAVLRAPLGTWSWRGLAETALLRAEREDAERVVDLSALEQRAQGILDPWRAIAVVAAKTAIDLKPSGFQELDALSRVYRSTGQLQAAEQALVRSARMMPAPSFHDWGSGEAFVTPLYSAILAASREGVTGAPSFEHGSLHRDIGEFALRQGDLESALEEMRLSKATAVDRDETYLATRGEARVLEALGRIDDAIAAWDAVIALGVESPADRRHRGILLRRANRNGDACRDLRESVRDEPTDETLRLFASATCEAAGEIETAERLLIDGLLLPTENPSRAKALISFYARVGKHSTALGILAAWTRDFPAREDFRQWARDLGAGQP